MNEISGYDAQEAPHALDACYISALGNVCPGQTSCGRTIDNLNGARGYELIQQRVLVDSRTGHRNELLEAAPRRAGDGNQIQLTRQTVGAREIRVRVPGSQQSRDLVETDG